MRSGMIVSPPNDWRVEFVHWLSHTTWSLLFRLGFRVRTCVLLAGLEEGQRWWLYSVDGPQDASLLKGMARLPSVDPAIVGPGVGAPPPDRAEALADAVRDRLTEADRAGEWLYFARPGMFVPGHEVVVVVGCSREDMQAAAWDTLPAFLLRPGTTWEASRSLSHAAVQAMLYESLMGLGPEGYRWQAPPMDRDTDALAYRAGDYLAASVALRLRDRQSMTLYAALNRVSALTYEGGEARAQLALALQEDLAVAPQALFARSIPLTDTRHVRKLLELTSLHTSLLATASCAYGLGSVAPTPEHPADHVSEVELLRRHHWELRHANRPLMRVRFGIPEMPRPPITKHEIADSLKRLTPDATEDHIAAVWAAVEGAVGQGRGAVVVVSTGAWREAERLRAQGMPLRTVRMTRELARRLTAIDGAVVLGADGQCHSVGTILDGIATERGDPARGARYNSAWRYYEWRRQQGDRLFIVVVSEDGATEMVPQFRPRVSREELENHVRRALRASASTPPDVDEYERATSWLRAHMFYLSPEQCERLNAAEKPVRAVWRPQLPGMGGMMMREFRADTDYDPSYLADPL